MFVFVIVAESYFNEPYFNVDIFNIKPMMVAHEVRLNIV